METRYGSKESIAYYDQIDKDQLEQNILNKIDNMAKKVKFYQSEKAQGKYQIPNDIKEMI
jgi:transcription initiation factor IIE alpha subunit